MSGGVHTPVRAGSFDVVVVAASLGGPAAVGQVVTALPPDLPVPVLVVQHRSPGIDREYAQALGRRGPLPVRLVVDGEPLVAGIGVLPARQTGIIDEAGRVRLRPGDGFRLADPLIVSAAKRYGPRALCVVLTGRLDDAAVGVRALKRRDGRTIVQDPASAEAAGMPSAALATGCVDLVMPLAHIAPAIVALTMAPGAADLFRVPPAPWAYLAA